MKLGLRLSSAEEDVGGLVGRALRTLAIIDDRPDHIAPNGAKGHVGLVYLRREPRAVAGNGEADHVRMDPLPAFLFARLLELPCHPAIVVADRAHAISLERVPEIGEDDRCVTGDALSCANR